MDYVELLVAIDKARKVFVYCNITTNEGEFFEVSKKNALKIINKQRWWLTDLLVNAHMSNRTLRIG